MNQTQNKKKQGTWLFLILILPIFFFFFLYIFGTNRYSLRVYYPIDSVKVAGKWKVTHHVLPPFAFTNQYGEKITNQTMRGKVNVVDFFFTKCGNPTLCPQMSKELARVQAMFAKKDKVQILSYSVDPENDTSETLLAYAKRYEAVKGKWHFLTGSKKEIYDLAYTGYKINAGQESNTITPEFLHATKFMLVDDLGRIRGYYDGIDAKDVDRLIVEINVLLYEMKVDNR